MDKREIYIWLKSSYDKLIVFIVLFCLLFSAVLLAVFVKREKKELAAARWEQPDIPPRQAKPIDVTFMQRTIDQVKNPRQIGEWTNRMMIAKLRVACVECGRPIPYEALVCPFRNCGATQPVPESPETKDSDFDGIPDEWEKKHGLNHLNPNDAHQDPDADGFSSLEEFTFGTHPNDGTNAPSPVAKLRLLKVGRLPMPLTFQGVQRPTRDEILFVIRNKHTRRDYYVKMGDVVEGYAISGFEPKTTNVWIGTMKIEENVSVLTLRKDNKDTHLTIYRDDNTGELAASLIFLIDNSKRLVKIGDVITLKKDQYKVVDIGKDAVIVADVLTGKRISIEPYSDIENNH